MSASEKRTTMVSVQLRSSLIRKARAAAYQGSTGSCLEQPDNQAENRTEQMAFYMEAHIGQAAGTLLWPASYKRLVQHSADVEKKLRRSLRVITQTHEALKVAMAASGGIVLVLSIFVLLIGALVGSAFGIFFSADDKEDYTVRTAIREIDQEYTSRLNTIKAGNYYDELELSGTRTGWREILAVYAVKCALDASDPVDVVTMTPEKQRKLSEVFWDMNELTYEVSTRTETEIEESTDEDGNAIEEEVEYTIYTLHIRVQGKAPVETAAQYSFTPDQQEQLQELLSPEYRELWSLVLYGVSIGGGGEGESDDIVAVALSQVGNVGGEPYWSWYGFSYRVEWCACFVSWCANEVGFIEAGIIPMFSYCPTGAGWFQSRGQWAGPNSTPSPGYLIFYDWENDGEIDHVGIVESCEGSVIHTIEGNTGDACRRFTYLVGTSFIAGYGMPDY